MTKILFIWTFFVSIILILNSCNIANYRALTKEESEKVYEHKVDLSQKELKTKLLIYINEKFHSSKSVIQINEEGLISGNAIADLGCSDPLCAITNSLEFTFILKYEDNFYKIKYIVKNILSNSSSGTQSLIPTSWGLYAEKIDEVFSILEFDLYNYLNKKNEIF